MAGSPSRREAFPFPALVVCADAPGMRRLDDRVAGRRRRAEAAWRVRLAKARPGDLDDAIRVVDEFAYERSFMINVGDEKGEILDAAIRRAAPRRLLELRYLLRLQRAAHGEGDAGGSPPALRLSSLADNAAVARRILEPGGDRVTVVSGRSATRRDRGAGIRARLAGHARSHPHRPRQGGRSTRSGN